MYNRSESTSPVEQPDSMDISRCTTGQDQLALLHNQTASYVQPVRINYPVAQPDNLDLSQCITGQAPLRNWIGLHADESRCTASDLHCEHSYLAHYHCPIHSYPVTQRIIRLCNRPSGYATGHPVMHPGSGWASVRNIYTQPFTEPLKALISVQVASWLLDDCRINDGLFK